MGTGIVVALRKALGVSRKPEVDPVVQNCIRNMNGGVFFDVGANVGEVSKALLPHASRVVSIEADAKTFAILRERVEGAGAVCVNALVGPEGDARTWLSNTGDNTGSTSVAPGDDPTGHEYLERSTMQCRSLDSIAVEHGWPSLVKIDVEGFEFGVLESAAQIMARRPVFIIEFNALCLSYFGRLNPRDALERLQAMFPVMERINGDKLEPLTNDYSFLYEHILNRRCVDNFVCRWAD